MIQRATDKVTGEGNPHTGERILQDSPLPVYQTDLVVPQIEDDSSADEADALEIPPKDWRQKLGDPPNSVDKRDYVDTSLIPDDEDNDLLPEEEFFGWDPDDD
jgi:hypothetical protein